MQPTIYRLFVYGSLRSGFHNAVYTYISRYFVFDGLGAVQGKLYDLGEYPGAVPATEEFYITGELYHIANKDEFSWAMEQLDEYEGIYVESGETPALFRREPTTVLYNDTMVTAWMYWYNRPITDQHRIESGDYIAYKMGIGR